MTPVLGEVARKSFNIIRSGSTAFPAFTGARGQIDFTAGALTRSGKAVNEGEGALRVAAIWIAVTLLADLIAGLATRMVLRGDGQRMPVKPAELPALWGDPNPDQTTFDIAVTEILSLTLSGKLFEQLGWTRAGALDIRWALDPGRCSLERLDDMGLRLKVTGMGDLENHPGKRPQFLRASLYTLPGQIDPVSPVRMAAELAGLSLAYDEMAARLAGRGFNPSAILTVGEAVQTELAEELSARLERLHGGSSGAGKVAVLGGKDIKLQPWTMSMVDAQFIEQYDRVFQILLALWRVPPTAAGMVDKPSTWGTGISEFSQGLERFSTRPLVQRMQAAIERYITRWADPDIQYRYVFDSLLSVSPKDRVEVQKTRVQFGLTSVERVLAQDDEPPFGEEETVYSQLAMGEADLNHLRAQAEVYGAFIRAGVAPDAAATVAGFDPSVLANIGLPVAAPPAGAGA